MIWGWIWIAVIVIAIIIEVMTDQLVSIWFVPGAVLATVLDFFTVSPIWQVLIVLVLAFAGILFVRKTLTKFKLDQANKTNIDAIIGERCVVSEKIDTFAGRGQVKVKGQIWSARGLKDDDAFEPGTTLTVVGVEGVKLICKQ